MEAKQMKGKKREGGEKYLSSDVVDGFYACAAFR